MEVPLVELANYPRFHDAAGAGLGLARSLVGPATVMLVHLDRGRLIVVNAQDTSDLRFSAGDIVDPESELATWLLDLMTCGAVEPSVAGESAVRPYAEIAGAPVRLSDGRTFGSLCALSNDSGVLSSDTATHLAAIARLIGYAIDAELLASHDRLTGLYSRTAFDDHLVLEIARSKRNGVCLAVLVVGFTTTGGADTRTDTWWLPRIAERLRASVREGDTISRIGPREFALIVPDLRDGEAARRVARALVDSLLDPFDMDSKAVSITPAVGVAMLPYDGFDARILMDRALLAMQQARLNDNERFGLSFDSKGLRLVGR